LPTYPRTSQKRDKFLTGKKECLGKSFSRGVCGRERKHLFKGITGITGEFLAGNVVILGGERLPDEEGNRQRRFTRSFLRKR